MCVNERAFSDVDLNSLLTLLVVYREQCVTRAAQCLNVKQPAVSNTLAKLRAQFGDPLFIRHCRGVRATARAIEIVEGLGPAFSQIEKVMSTASPCASHSFQASGAPIDETT